MQGNKKTVVDGMKESEASTKPIEDEHQDTLEGPRLTHKRSEQRATLCFMAWNLKQPENAGERPVYQYPATASEKPHSYSMQLIDVKWVRAPGYPDILNARKPWASTPKTYPSEVEWKLEESSIN